MAAQYRHPSLKQQLGLAHDPNAGDHVVTSKGQRLTRTISAGGHELDSSQPGFPVYHRRIANPFPLACIATGAPLLMLGLLLVRNRNVTNPAIFLVIGLPLGMVGNFTASMFAFAEGSTYLATLSGSFGGLIGGLALLYLPWTGVQQSFIASATSQVAGLEEFHKALAMCYFVGLIPIFLIFVASFRTSAPLAVAMLLVVVAFGCAGGAYVHGATHLAAETAAGAFLIVVGVLFFYSALSTMMAEGGAPILPVFPLPRID